MSESRSMLGLSTASLIDISEEIINQQRSVRFSVSGLSMYPFINSGDVIEVEPVEISLISPGEIIFFKNAAGHAFVHRVIRKEVNADGVFLVTKGDAFRGVDLPVSGKQILGRVTSVEGSGRKVDWTKFRMKTFGSALAYGYPYSYRLFGKMRKVRTYIKDLFRTLFRGRKNAW